jgi:hypothetical protein
MEAVNFTSDPKSNDHYGYILEGGWVSPSGSKKSVNYINRLVPGTSHTDIDNTITNIVVDLINGFLFHKKDPLSEVDKMDMSKVPVIYEKSSKVGNSSF